MPHKPPNVLTVYRRVKRKIGGEHNTRKEIHDIVKGAQKGEGSPGMLTVQNSALTDFEKDTASHDIQNKKWAEPRVDKIHSILSSAMEHSTSPGGVNALKKSIEDARGVYKSIHLAYQEAGSKLAGSIAQAAMILKEELDLKTLTTWT